MTPKLFHLPGCPFCVKVRREAQRLGLALELVDISQVPAARQLLLQERGRATVPVLVTEQDGVPSLLGESEDIVRYLREHADHLPRVA